MTGMAALEPWEMPLDGIRLIEASAGTGKTYSITSLYLRLLLERGLAVEQILVVTFTNAAAEELGERIRRRLSQSLSMLDGHAGHDTETDPGFAAWLRARPDPDRDRAALRAALASLDQAAVSTIHGLAQRLLREQAFETGAPFEVELLEEESGLRLGAVQDFWRCWMADPAVGKGMRRLVLANWKGPEALLRDIGVRLDSDEVRLQPGAVGDPRQLEDALAALEEAHARLRTAHEAHADGLEEVMRQALEGMNKRSYKPEAIAQAMDELASVCRSGTPPLKVGGKLDLLSSGRILGGARKGFTPPEHPLFTPCQAYLDSLDRVKSIWNGCRAGFLRQAREAVRARVRERKARQGAMGFDDLLTALADALDAAGGGRLVEALRRRYPVAMIDEFQDTDAVQYRIFSRIYRDAGKDHGLFLIGDPKQAIYGFRGGDIHTYLRAAGDAGNRYCLETNWRSSRHLVEAFNRLFGRRDDVFVQEGIEYRPVNPSPRADEEPLLIGGERPVPMQFWRLRLTPGNSTKGRSPMILTDHARREAATHCARHVAWLLADNGTLGERRLRGGDIALLVRSHREGEVVREALREQGLASVAMGPESVFGTPEAEGLLALLEAVAACEDERLLRAVLGGDLMACDAGQLDAWLRDEVEWEKVLERFFDYRRLWEERGFIQAMMHLFHQEGLAERLLGDTQGERRLTNLFQLLELCQHASVRSPGIEPLLRWLREQVELRPQGEAQRLRLESDAELVRIVTMHAAKGLEYPVVYIPFPWSASESPKGPFLYHDAEGGTCLYLDGWGAAPAGVKEAWKRESLAEAMRLFYVAVTRASRLCILPWGRVNRGENSAFASLLYSGERMGDVELPEEEVLFGSLEEMSESCPRGMVVCDPPEPAAARPRSGEEPPLEARPFRGRVEGGWRVSSYSGLLRGGESDLPDFDAGARIESESARPDPVQALPAGARFGIFLHGLLEQIDFTDHSASAVTPLIERLSRRHGLQLDAGGQAGVLELLDRSLRTRLPGAGLALSDMPRGRRLDEMEFHFRVGSLSVHRLQAALAGQAGWEEAARGLQFGELHGLLHGFVDLIFEHQGRYHLADYKSNRLEGYGSAELEEAMQAHHYPLQALIYALALHRHLGSRLPGYDPDRHLGSVHYLFLRGMRPGTDRGIWHRPLSGALLMALEQAFGREVAA